MGRWQLWEDKILSQSLNLKSQQYFTPCSNISHLSHVSCMCLSVVALYYRGRQNLHPDKAQANFICLGGLGLEMWGRRNGIQKYEEPKTCQVEPFKAHAQPNTFSLGVNVLPIQGWLSVRRFQWILYNHILMRVTLCKHHSNIPLPIWPLVTLWWCMDSTHAGKNL